MIDVVRRLSRLRSREHTECRRCGTSVDDSASRCPTCGSEGIARYDL